MLEKSGTCQSCGYEKKHCICNAKDTYGTIHLRNTSGKRRMYQNYSNYHSKDYEDYSRTSAIRPQNVQERKIMEELHPINNELLITFIERTAKAEEKLTEYALNHHVYGTSKTWSCHTTSRYCFICVMSQFIDVNRALYESLQEIIPNLSEVHIKVSEVPNGYPELSLYLAQSN